MMVIGSLDFWMGMWISLMVAWLNGMVAGLLCGLMMVVGLLDDGGCVGCLGSVREVRVWGGGLGKQRWKREEVFVWGLWVFLNSVSVSVYFQAPCIAPANSVWGSGKLRFEGCGSSFSIRSLFGLFGVGFKWVRDWETEREFRESEGLCESSERVRDKEMFRKSEGVNRMRGKKEMTWQPPIGWRKTLVLCQAWPNVYSYFI